VTAGLTGGPSGGSAVPVLVTVLASGPVVPKVPPPVSATVVALHTFRTGIAARFAGTVAGPVVGGRPVSYRATLAQRLTTPDCSLTGDSPPVSPVTQRTLQNAPPHLDPHRPRRRGS
jgi:hypothetical protein